MSAKTNSKMAEYFERRSRTARLPDDRKRFTAAALRYRQRAMEDRESVDPGQDPGEQLAFNAQEKDSQAQEVTKQAERQVQNRRTRHEVRAANE